MNEEPRTEAKQKLADLIARVMEDGKIDASEREQLQAVYRQAILTVADVKEVLSRYVRAVQTEVLADGHVTEDERRRCKAIVAELKLPPALLPQGFKAIIGMTV